MGCSEFSDQVNYCGQGQSGPVGGKESLYARIPPACRLDPPLLLPPSRSQSGAAAAPVTLSIHRCCHSRSDLSVPLLTLELPLLTRSLSPSLLPPPSRSLDRSLLQVPTRSLHPSLLLQPPSCSLDSTLLLPLPTHQCRHLFRVWKKFPS